MVNKTTLKIARVVMFGLEWFALAVVLLLLPIAIMKLASVPLWMMLTYSVGGVSLLLRYLYDG